MVDTTKVKSIVADLQELGTAFSTVANPLKQYIDDLNGGVGSNIVVTQTSPPGGASTFTASPADPTLCFVFIGGVFQTEGVHYTISGSDITFTTTVEEGLIVTFVERKLVSNGVIPGGSAGQFLGKTGPTDGQYSWLDLPNTGGGGGGSNPGTSLSLAHFSNMSNASPTKDFDLFSNMLLTRTAVGSYTVSFVGLTFPTANSYVVNITADHSGSANLRVPRIVTRTTTGFTFLIENQAATNTDPSGGVNILVSGDPQLLTTNMISEPVGSVLWFPADTPPVGYLECNGQSVSKTTYAALYNVLSSSVGGSPWGETSTTFNLPDLRGEFIRGWSHGRSGVDTGRAFGSSQSGSNAPHTHLTVANDAFPTNSDIYDVTRKYTAKVGPISSTAYYSLGGVATVPTVGETTSQGTEARPRNIALLPCIKAVPDFNNALANQIVESFTVTAINQSIFSTTTVDTRYAYIFVDGAYQPPTEYTTPTSSVLQFSSPVLKGSQVDVVKVYAASTPAASSTEVSTATANNVMLTPANLKHSLFVIDAWAKCNSDGTLQAGVGITTTRISTGKYRFTLATPYTHSNYVTVVTAEQDAEGDSRICEYIYGKSNSLFYVNTQTAGGTNVDKKINVIVIGL